MTPLTPSAAIIIAISATAGVLVLGGLWRVATWWARRVSARRALRKVRKRSQPPTRAP